MKKGTILVATLFSFLFVQSVIAQEDTRQVRKEVQLEKLNDEITLTIKTIDGKNISEEVFTGEEAEQKLKELEKMDEKKIVSSEEVREEIRVDEVDGMRRLTINRYDNGKVTEEVLIGEAADKKLGELKTHENGSVKIELDEHTAE